MQRSLRIRVNVIPLEAARRTCTCGTTILTLRTGHHAIRLEDTATHGITERFDRTGQVTAYDHVPVYPTHNCATHDDVAPPVALRSGATIDHP